MQRIFIFLMNLLFVLIIQAQPHFFVKQWDKRFGGINSDGFQSFCQTSNGGFILGGFSNSPLGGDKTQPSWDTTNFFSDYWIVKIDSFGNKEWDKRFGGIGEDDLIEVSQVQDGGYILGGHSGSGMNGDKTQQNWGGFDDWLVKVDSHGNYQWDKRYGGTLDESFNALTVTHDNGYIFGGYSNSPASGDKTQGNWDSNYVWDDIWIVKLDSSGNKQWDKRFGGTKQDRLGSIHQTADNNYIIVGSSSSAIGGDKTQANWDITNITFDCWIVKIDSAGNKLWDKRYGGNKDDGAASIIETEDGGYIIGAGSYSDISGDKTNDKKAYWVIRIDSIGNKLWDKGFSESNGLATFSKTFEGGCLLSGISQSNAGGDKSENNLGSTQIWIVKTDAVGNKQWDKTIFTEKYCEGYAIQTTDGCYAVCAYTASGIGGYKTQANWDTTELTYDYWIMKFCMDTVTGIDDGQETQHTRQIQVYPNPFTSDLSIALKGENIHEGTFTITNAIGQVIYRREENNLATGYTKVLDLSYLPNGVYFVSVSAVGETVTKKVVKQ